MLFNRFIIMMTLFISCADCIPIFCATNHRYDSSDDFIILDDHAQPRTIREWLARDENQKKLFYAALVVGGIFFLYEYGGRIYAWLTNSFIPWWRDSYIDFQGHKLCGKEWAHTAADGRKIIVRQLHVQNQVGASCGYGALYWVERIKNALDGKDVLVQDEMYNEKRIDEVHGPKGRRRLPIIEERIKKTNPEIERSNAHIKATHGNPRHIAMALPVSGDWITGHELRSIVITEGLFHSHTVFDDVLAIGIENMDIATPRCREAIHSGKHHSHGFILGTMEHARDGRIEAARDNGHFCGVVHSTDGKGSSIYTIIDTLNILHVNDHIVGRLIEAIDGEYK